MRPADLFDRDTEWGDLTAFITSPSRGLSLAIVSGRRRIGKSFLLRRIVGSGAYHQGIQEERTPALARIGDLIADRQHIPGGALRFGDWKAAVGALLDSVSTGTVVIDEFPYLVQRSPELASMLQLLYDERRDGPPLRLILCGSSLSTMEHLLAGSQPLRGRAQLDLRMSAFDYRVSRRFWNIADHRTAFQLDALLGGAPGYRDLVLGDAPQSLDEFPEWLGTTVMNPSHALYREEEFLLREDPRLADQTLYRSILAAVAAGERTPSRLGGRLGRDRTALSALLNNLMTAGFLRKQTDLANTRAVTYLVADPIIRYSQLILVPNRARLDERRWMDVWAATEQTWRAQVLGPHLEDLAHVWLMRYASESTIGGTPTVVGRLVVADRADKTSIEIDAAVRDATGRILLIGEVKATVDPRGIADLGRLERCRSLLGPDGGGAKLLIVSLNGFERSLTAAASSRSDVELVDAARLYEGT